jgi:hypothetical protein
MPCRLHINVVDVPLAILVAQKMVLEKDFVTIKPRNKPQRP